MKTTIAIMGPTGAGKDTQARLLVEQYKYHLIDAGNLVRLQAEHNLELARHVDSGLLADDDLVNDLVAAKIDELLPHDRLISDGFPRRLNQAKWLDEYLAEAGRQLDGVIYLKLDAAKILDRLAKRGRDDDQAAAVRHRLEVFESETLPVIEFYAKRGLVREINGDQTVEQIQSQIMDFIR